MGCTVIGFSFVGHVMTGSQTHQNEVLRDGEIVTATTPSEVFFECAGGVGDDL